jgi:hypothetical protein
MTRTASFSPGMAERIGHGSAGVESSSAVTLGVGSPPPSICPRAFPSSGRSGLARRPREEAAHQRTQRCATALRAGNLGFVMLADGEGDAYVPSTVVTVVFVHSHGGSSSKCLTPVDGPEGVEPKRTAGAIPPLDASHHREARRPLAFTRTFTASGTTAFLLLSRGVRRAQTRVGSARRPRARRRELRRARIACCHCKK